jgi:hypothetical protein
MRSGKWDDDALLAEHQRLVNETLGEEDGVLIIDGSDFPKHGGHSAGVAPQWCGHTGKKDNCQAGVFLGYASRKGATFLDRRLYLPESWFGEDYRVNPNIKLVGEYNYSGGRLPFSLFFVFLLIALERLNELSSFLKQHLCVDQDNYTAPTSLMLGFTWSHAQRGQQKGLGVLQRFFVHRWFPRKSICGPG